MSVRLVGPDFVPDPPRQRERFERHSWRRTPQIWPEYPLDKTCRHCGLRQVTYSWGFAFDLAWPGEELSRCHTILPRCGDVLGARAESSTEPEDAG